jgi:hypothetical protein
MVRGLGFGPCLSQLGLKVLDTVGRQIEGFTLLLLDPLGVSQAVKQVGAHVVAGNQPQVVDELKGDHADACLLRRFASRLLIHVIGLPAYSG